MAKLANMNLGILEILPESEELAMQNLAALVQRRDGTSYRARGLFCGFRGAQSLVMDSFERRSTAKEEDAAGRTRASGGGHNAGSGNGCNPVAFPTRCGATDQLWPDEEAGLSESDLVYVQMELHPSSLKLWGKCVLCNKWVDRWHCNSNNHLRHVLQLAAATSASAPSSTRPASQSCAPPSPSKAGAFAEDSLDNQVFFFQTGMQAS